MTIAVKCPKCKHIARVNDSLAGKAAKCPSCRGIVRIPATQGDSTAPAPVPTSAGASTEAWYVRTPDGETFGPISRSELNSWVEEGRIDVECYLLEKGEKEWRTAAEIYPQLGGDGETSIAAPSTTGGGIAIETASSGSRLPAFRPRQYPAMTVVKFFYYGLAGLTVVSFLVSCLVIILFGAALVGIGDASGILPMLVMLLLSLLIHASIICMFLFMAELVKILMDIQANTQATSHYTRAAAR